MELNLRVDVASTDKPTVLVARVRSALAKEFGDDIKVVSDISDEERQAGEEEKQNKLQESDFVQKKYDKESETIERIVASISDDELGVYKYADADMRLMKKYEIATLKLGEAIDGIRE